MIRTTCLLAALLMFLPWLKSAEPAAGSAAPQFDAAPFAVSQTADEDGRVYYLQWNEPRFIRSVEVEFAPQADLPAKERLRIEYWRQCWNGEPATPLAERNPCRNGWIKMDDWFNGQWKAADTLVRAEGRTFHFTFAPSDKKEFTRAKVGVTYRETLKLRLCSDTPLPKIARVRVLNDAAVRPVKLKLDFGTAKNPAMNPSDAEQCSLEVYNGAIERVRAAPGSEAKVTADRRFVLPASGRGTVELDVLAASDPHEPQADRTVVTVRSPCRSFSFAPDEVLREGLIVVDDLGVLVTRADDAATLESWRQTARESGRLTIRNRVSAEPEQTLSRAWEDMPLKRKLYYVHGLPGNRDAFRQLPNGDLTILNFKRRFQWQPSPRDTGSRAWNGDFSVGFGFPDAVRGDRELLEGWLPLLRSTWTEGPLFYEQLTVVDTLRGNVGKTGGNGSASDDIRLDDPTAILMKVRILNTSASDRATARLMLSAADARRGDSLSLEGDRVWGKQSRNQRPFRFIWKEHKPGSVTPDDGRLAWARELGPGESHEMFFSVPSVTLKEEKEIAALSERSFADDSRRLIAYWRSRNHATAELRTPERWLNDFYKAHLQHMEINCLRDLEASRRYAAVGSSNYLVYPNESMMIVSDLDRRGLHQLAEQCLQTWLDFQGKTIFPGTYQTKDGVFNSSGGSEWGGYNKAHGYTLWGLAEHWKYTRNREWLERAAPHIVAACDWVIRERQATMKMKPDGTRPIEYGFLPAGSLEDVKDYWFWQATNAATVWGFEAAAAALGDLGHAEAPRLVKEARAYREDVLRGLTEARILAPVVRLRDGTSVPKYPSHLHLRGRAGGWIRETLEGSMFLPIYGLLAPHAPETAWILDDHEDNLYISEFYGYDIPTFDPFWFSRGGFSMQANLLDGPLPYLYRDDIKHYVRAVLNGFASGFDPEVRMLNEHSSPELGYYAGDHFKTSDEAQVTYWLRLMFVREAGEELYLGQAVPRYWLADGNTIGIERANTYFGPLSFQMTSKAGEGEIRAMYTPPERNPPKTVYLRLRHPQEKPIRSVTVNGKTYDKFDPQKEWIILPGNLTGIQTIVARY